MHAMERGKVTEDVFVGEDDPQFLIKSVLIRMNKQLELIRDFLKKEIPNKSLADLQTLLEEYQEIYFQVLEEGANLTGEEKISFDNFIEYSKWQKKLWLKNIG